MGSGNNSMGGQSKNRFGSFGSFGGMKPMGSGYNSGSNQNWFNGSADTGGNNWSSQFWNPNTSYSSGSAGMGNNGAMPSSYGYDGTGNQGGFDFGNFDFGGLLNNFMGGYGQQFGTPSNAYDYGMTQVGQGNVGGYAMDPTTQTGNSANTYNPYTPQIEPDPVPDTPTTPAGWTPDAVTKYGNRRQMSNQELRAGIKDLRSQNSWVDQAGAGTGTYANYLDQNQMPNRNQFDNRNQYLRNMLRFEQGRENILNASNPDTWNGGNAVAPDLGVNPFNRTPSTPTPVAPTPKPTPGFLQGGGNGGGNNNGGGGNNRPAAADPFRNSGRR